MSPAETKPISISVVAAEDWMMAVTAAPEATATIRLRESPVSSWRSRPPSGALQAVAAQPDAVEQQRGAAEQREQDRHGVGSASGRRDAAAQQLGGREVTGEVAGVVQGDQARRPHDRERGVVDAQPPEVVERAPSRWHA